VTAGRLGFFTGPGGQVWRTDGSRRGTFPVTNVSFAPADPGMRGLSAAGDRVYFSPGSGQVWTSDGTVAGTGRVGAVPLAGKEGVAAGGFTPFGDALLFAAEDGPHGNELRRIEPAAPTPPQTSNPDLTATLSGAAPGAERAGVARGVARVALMNRGGAAAPPFETRLVLSTDGVADASDVVVGTVPPRGKPMPAGKVRLVNVRYTVPPELEDGSYRLLAVADAGGAVAEADESNNTAAAEPFIHRQAFVDLQLSVHTPPGPLAAGGGGEVRVVISNRGNLPARGVATATLTAIPTSVVNSTPVPLGTQRVRISLVGGAGRVFTLRFTIPADLAPRTYRLVIALDASLDPADRDNTNNSTFTDLVIR
jgi:hypothetical protein